jgi:hypothetical protein
VKRKPARPAVKVAEKLADKPKSEANKAKEKILKALKKLHPMG